jgi:hypothetical protein
MLKLSVELQVQLGAACRAAVGSGWLARACQRRVTVTGTVANSDRASDGAPGPTEAVTGDGPGPGPPWSTRSGWPGWLRLSPGPRAPARVFGMSAGRGGARRCRRPNLKVGHSIPRWQARWPGGGFRPTRTRGR